MCVEPFCKMYCLCVKCASSAMWRCNWLQRIDGWIFISTFLSALTLVLYHLYIVQIQIQRQRQSKLNLYIDLRCSSSSPLLQCLHVGCFDIWTGRTIIILYSHWWDDCVQTRLKTNRKKINFQFHFPFLLSLTIIIMDSSSVKGWWLLSLMMMLRMMTMMMMMIPIKWMRWQRWDWVLTMGSHNVWWDSSANDDGLALLPPSSSSSWSSWSWLLPSSSSWSWWSSSPTLSKTSSSSARSSSASFPYHSPPTQQLHSSFSSDCSSWYMHRTIIWYNM